MMLRTRLLLSTVFGLLVIGLSAQTDNQYLSAKDSDPAAKATLDQIRKKYDAYRTLDVDFNLEIELPEQEMESQRGTLQREGQKYHFLLASQEVISDGKALYFILHNNKEIQINELPEPGDDAGILSPESLFSFYDNDNFIAMLVDERTERGRVYQYIELKPTSAESEYSKLRVVVDRSAKTVQRLKAFGKDGSRYTFVVNSFKPNTALPASTFAFDKANYPGYYVEDLR